MAFSSIVSNKIATGRLKSAYNMVVMTGQKFPYLIIKDGNQGQLFSFETRVCPNAGRRKS